MTRELARNILTELKNLMAKEKEPLSEEQEALEMAISSLEQNESAEAWYRTFVEKFESCEDCVSREAVMFLLKRPFQLGGIDSYTYGAIKELPSVQPNHKEQWIKVTDRLPENNDPVNITWVNHNPEHYYEDIKDETFTATGQYHKGKWFWFSATCQDYLDEYGYSVVDAVDENIEIIAWMPLPEPHKADMRGVQ